MIAEEARGYSPAGPVASQPAMAAKVASPTQEPSRLNHRKQRPSPRRKRQPASATTVSRARRIIQSTSAATGTRARGSKEDRAAGSSAQCEYDVTTRMEKGSTNGAKLTSFPKNELIGTMAKASPTRRAGVPAQRSRGRAWSR